MKKLIRCSSILLACALSILAFGACSAGGLVGGQCTQNFWNCSGACVDLEEDADHCGACGVGCAINQICSEAACIEGEEPIGNVSVESLKGMSDGDENNGEQLQCEEGVLTTACGTSCVDILSDAANCGSCGQICESGICSFGSCRGESNGHMVAICQSYESYAPSASRLLGNAIFLAPNSAVRILGYAEYTPSLIVDGLESALEESAQLLERDYELTRSVQAADVTNLVRSDYDVLLIYDQPDAPGGIWSRQAGSWRDALENFVAQGGIVIVTTGGQESTEVFELVSKLNILETTGTQRFDDQVYQLQSPGDVLALGVVSAFRASPASCTFETSVLPSNRLVYVTSDSPPNLGLGNPGAVHRLVLPSSQIDLR